MWFFSGCSLFHTFSFSYTFPALILLIFQCQWLLRRLKEEAISARSHNIDAEEIIGTLSASQKRAPNATICFLSCRMRAQKTKLLNIWTVLVKREHILQKAVLYGRKQADKRQVRKLELREVIICRHEDKRQKRDEKAREALENGFKTEDWKM